MGNRDFGVCGLDRFLAVERYRELQWLSVSTHRLVVERLRKLVALAVFSSDAMARPRTGPSRSCWSWSPPPQAAAARHRASGAPARPTVP